MGWVYLITNTENGKQYVGKTVNKYLSNRWSGHKHSARNGSPYYFHKAIRKYGPDVFVVTPLGRFNEPTLGLAEQLFITELGTRAPKGYNLTDGGEGVSGFKRTPEQCRKMSESLKGRRLSDTHKENIRHGCLGINKGHIKSPETLKRMSEARKGKPSPLRGRITSNTYGAIQARAYRERLRTAGIARSARVPSMHPEAIRARVKRQRQKEASYGI